MQESVKDLPKGAEIEGQMSRFQHLGQEGGGKAQIQVGIHKAKLS